MNTLDLFRLDGKTAIVTGGGRGLGRYMAEALSDAGANVVLCSRKLEPLREVQHEVSARGGHALAFSCDVTEQQSVEKVVSATEEVFGSIDILVNNSGATWGAPPAEMPLEKFERVLAVNVRGRSLCLRPSGGA
jgi:NAD(P)-dependent dehydrogenase (short-subunit alcohol dehydrogenase family)